MKILFNTYPIAFDKPGGGERQLLDYKRYLKEVDIQVDLYNQWKPIEKDYDILHFFSVQQGSLPFLDYIKKTHHLPIVISPNFWPDPDEWKLSGVYDEVITTLWLADKIIVNSYIEEEWMVRHLKIDSLFIGIVHNMYNDIFLEPVSTELFKNEYSIEGPFILNVGNIEKRKNQLTMLEALKAFPEYKYVCIGGVRDMDYFNQCKELGGDNFIYIPQLHNEDPLLRSAYSGCEFFAMPSLVETPSISALEAAVCGAKILITDIGSAPEYFKSFAEYINPYDIQSIQKSIRVLLEQGKTDDLREHIKENYSAAKVGEELMAVYDSINR